MDYLKKISIAFELHSVDEIKECFTNGIDSNMLIDGEPLIYKLINMYSRGPVFKECIKAFVDHGVHVEDKVLLSVLLDDATALDNLLKADSALVQKKYSLSCTFTPLYQASLLHVCAEYNHLACAEILVRHGLDVNTKAGIDKNGFGGHTPIFHTVNQSGNKCMDTMQYLLTKKADILLTVKGLTWGNGYDWETFIPSVNPISYAMMGLLRQFQRTEQEIYEVVYLLLKAAYNIDYKPLNIPNRYLNS